MKAKYVLLMGCISENYGQRFYSLNTPNTDHTKSAMGATWYKILGYAETKEEAQTKLYGRSFK